MWDQALAALRAVEEQTGKTFGDPKNPLLVSVRSGAKFSMPGMMDTVLNLGLNDETVQGLIALTGDERFCLRRLSPLHPDVLQDRARRQARRLRAQDRRVQAARPARKTDADIPADALKQHGARTSSRSRATPRAATSPTTRYEQLRLAIEAVFASWNNKRAIDYRNFNKIPHDLGTAVNVQTMVFGNMGDDRATGVAFTRNPSTGEKKLYGEYLVNAQGEDVVAGIRTPRRSPSWPMRCPASTEQFQEIAERLEQHYRDMQDLEFTIEHGKLYMLQTRSAKRTAAAAVKIAVDMVSEGLITEEEAVQRVEPGQVVQLLLPRFDENDITRAKRSAGASWRKGVNASPARRSARRSSTPTAPRRRARRASTIILVRQETSPDDVHGMMVAKGILTAVAARAATRRWWRAAWACRGRRLRGASAWTTRSASSTVHGIGRRGPRGRRDLD